MPDTVFEQLLADAIGLDAASLGSTAVAAAVLDRMAACGSRDAAEYTARVAAAPEELQALVEAVVVPETWFFRDGEPFAFLADYVRREWAPAHPVGSFRALSVPCSTGEEPFSIAITLREAGLDADRCQVDAADVSQRLLQRAAAAVYGSNSFRGSVLDGNARYFTPAPGGFEVKPEIRSRVRFFQANLLADGFLTGAPPYHVVFCRNLLIYQHAAARRTILRALDRCLVPGGLLFVGHAERISALGHEYDTVPRRGAFACRKRPPLCPATPPIQTGRAALPKPAPRTARPESPTRVGRDLPLQPLSSAEAPGVAPTPAGHVEQVRRLADQGRLHEAEALCESALKQNVHDPMIYFLLGIIRDRAGQVASAEECLNRALYLRADFHDALLYLSLLRARRGDGDGARRLRQRAARAEGRGEVSS